MKYRENIYLTHTALYAPVLTHRRISALMLIVRGYKLWYHQLMPIAKLTSAQSATKAWKVSPDKSLRHTA